MTTSGDFHAVRNVGGFGHLTATEQEVYGVLCSWKEKPDGFRHGDRQTIARQVRRELVTVSRAMRSLWDKGMFADYGRTKFGVRVRLKSDLLRQAARIALAALVEAKRVRQRMRLAVPQIAAALAKLWQKCQCYHRDSTLNVPSEFKEKAAPLSCVLGAVPAPSALDLAISAGLAARGIAENGRST